MLIGTNGLTDPKVIALPDMEGNTRDFIAFNLQEGRSGRFKKVAYDTRPNYELGDRSGRHLIYAPAGHVLPETYAMSSSVINADYYVTANIENFRKEQASSDFRRSCYAYETDCNEVFEVSRLADSIVCNMVTNVVRMQTSDTGDITGFLLTPTELPFYFTDREIVTLRDMLHFQVPATAGAPVSYEEMMRHVENAQRPKPKAAKKIVPYCR